MGWSDPAAQHPCGEALSAKRLLIVLEQHLVGDFGPAVQVLQHLLIQSPCERHDLDPGDRLPSTEGLVQELRNGGCVAVVRERPGRLIARCELGIEEDDADARHM